MYYKTIMIRIKDDPVSEKYAAYCSRSWTHAGWDLRFYDAVTPETLHLQSGLTFGTRGNGKELTDTEKACFYSQYNLWKKCALENVPMLILEHDAMLRKPKMINYDPNLHAQFLGQHAMEAVMFHPTFASMLVYHCENNEISGPMQLVDGLLGYFRTGKQSRHALPHARYIGPHAPVHSVLDPTIGTSVVHGSGSTTDRVISKGNPAEHLRSDRDLFRLVKLPELDSYE